MEEFIVLITLIIYLVSIFIVSYTSYSLFKFKAIFDWFSINNFFNDLLPKFDYNKTNLYTYKTKALILLIDIILFIFINLIFVIIGIFLINIKYYIIFFLLMGIISFFKFFIYILLIIKLKIKFRRNPSETEDDCISYFKSIQDIYNYNELINYELIDDSAFLWGNNKIVEINTYKTSLEKIIKKIKIKDTKTIYLKFMFVFKNYLSNISIYGSKINWEGKIIIKINKENSNLLLLKKALISNFLYYMNKNI
ncbi:hypothetical protein [Spiroplasma turonicum]|uniref:Transmembrane protein n=1 Tax=Spiroplasma turonicum TaxID=216946 RepID=A0A0K1P7B1_9MOLU|nr:hypothetical protein [Spiroplasma turonicum]AKU80173.1 hypothetical protein STURON_00927 [Spiroplasma turonicum]ALX71173.1 hypothetical protein STURO_v1c09220 [Spiroplasma turonicum]